MDRLDRRQQKTRKAIFDAFIELIGLKSYELITIQNIIDRANIGRSTYYAHFSTKEALVKAMCDEMFSRVIQSVRECKHSHHNCDELQCGHEHHNRSPFRHILTHLEEDDFHILTLLTSDSREMILRYFKDNMNEFVRSEVLTRCTIPRGLPEEFVVAHISGSFVEMLYWWLNHDRQYSLDELDQYYCSLLNLTF